jgi:hypothetical protein
VTVDEIIADPRSALELPDGSFPVSIIIAVEYMTPGSDDAPQRRRLAVVADDDLPPWTAIGMLRYSIQLNLDEVGEHPDYDE